MIGEKKIMTFDEFITRIIERTPDKNVASDLQRLLDLWKALNANEKPTQEESKQAIPFTYIDEWIKTHDDFVSTRPVRYMVQDYKFEVLGVNHDGDEI